MVVNYFVLRQVRIDDAMKLKLLPKTFLKLKMSYMKPFNSIGCLTYI